MLREIKAGKITAAVARLLKEAAFELPGDVLKALRSAQKSEPSPLGRETLERLIENAAIARQEKLPLCQDCGMVTVFLEIGQDVHITGGDLAEAVQAGVRKAYDEEFLRKSVVRQPFSARVNTGDNTPAVIHTELVPGDRLRITVMPKGGGSKNMTRLFMLTPAEGRKGIIESVVRAVDEAGSNPCPPVIVGVGIGGSAEKALLMSKMALLRPIGQPSPDPEDAALEKELLEKVNALGIGPEGFGGRTTALAVHVETFPTHLASLPLAVSLLCHAARHKETVI
ncbi:MAG: fumarate hydratase [Chloroflexota bacterium]